MENNDEKKMSGGGGDITKWDITTKFSLFYNQVNSRKRCLAHEVHINY